MIRIGRSKVLLKNALLQNSTDNTCAAASFFLNNFIGKDNCARYFPVNFQAFVITLVLKKTSSDCA